MAKYHLHIEATHRQTEATKVIDEDIDPDQIRIVVPERISKLEEEGYRIDRLKCPTNAESGDETG